jgi:hypothetical protein
MLFLHWEYATTYAFHSQLLYENQSYLSSYLTSKERHGLYKKEKSERIKEQKALVLKKERMRKRKVAMPSQKKLEKGNFSKEYHFP